MLKLNLSRFARPIMDEIRDADFPVFYVFFCTEIYEITRHRIDTIFMFYSTFSQHYLLCKKSLLIKFTLVNYKVVGALMPHLYQMQTQIHNLIQTSMSALRNYLGEIWSAASFIYLVLYALESVRLTFRRSRHTQIANGIAGLPFVLKPCKAA